MAGYSKRSLVEKLGIKEGWKIAILGAPKNYRAMLGDLPRGVVVNKKPAERLPFVHFFCDKRNDLENKLPELKGSLLLDGMLWVSWPKGSSGVPTDLNENVVREIALSNALVDVKVCAVDETWSGLKLVRQLKDRK